MGIEALRTNLSGQRVVPISSTEWEDWVSASATRNHVLENPLLDWLNHWGAEKGYSPDDPSAFDERTDFRTFIFRKGHEFEQSVLAHLSTLAEIHTLHDGDYEGRRDIAVAEATFEAMTRGDEIIYQGVLRDAETRTWGSPDFLIRSDVLARLFPNTLNAAEATTSAPDLPGGWHYRVVDSKFANLSLLAGGALGNTGSAPAYKVQVFLYNRALGRLQGYEPPESFLLGRGWEQKSGAETTRVQNCMDRLAPVPQDYASRVRGTLPSQADAAVTWIRRMRREAADWTPTPEPTVDELRVNAKGDNEPWTQAVRDIVAETEDLTVLYYVGAQKRIEANQQGVTHWRDPGLTPAAVGIGGVKMVPRFQALLDVNRESAGPALRPAHVVAGRDEWHTQPPLEFYVDFETVSSLDDDFSRIPDRGGQELIFMIGCGHIEDGEWVFRCFTTDRLSESHEAEIIDAWFGHMEMVTERLAPGADPKAIHWSHAEVTWLETAWYAAVKRHPEKHWPSPNWFDFLTQVVREEPVVVRGAHGFGLKGVGKAMRELGLIETEWGDGPTDGLGAMIGAWWCEHEAERLDKRLTELDLMQQIASYNEVDCRVISDIVTYLRTSH